MNSPLFPEARVPRSLPIKVILGKKEYSFLISA
jgi:hypothetical protein